MMVRHSEFSTAGIRADGGHVAPLDLDDDGAVIFLAPCMDMVTGSAQVAIVEGTGSAFVLTIIVSNDPKGKVYANHPSSITLTNSAQISQAYSVCGYLWHGVRLSTVNGGNCLGHVYLVAKDTPP